MPYSPKINTVIERAPADAAKKLGELGVATVHEANKRTGLMFGIRPVATGVSVGGTAITCLDFAGDNLMLHVALDLAQPGDIIVAAVTSPSSHGMFGELMATSCQARGVAGIVLDAAARDSMLLREMGFPVWSRWVSAAGTTKLHPGWANTPVCCGGQIVCPGDVVVADDDGVVVVARADAPAVLDAASERAEHEEQSRAKNASGHSSLDNGGRRELVAPYYN